MSPAVKDPRPGSGPAWRKHPGHRFWWIIVIKTLYCGQEVRIGPSTDSGFYFLTAGDQSSKQGDLNTLSGAFETVMRVHYPTALGRIAIRMVPCPAVCVEAFSLVSK